MTRRIGRTADSDRQHLGDGLEEQVALDVGGGSSARIVGTSCNSSGSSTASAPRLATLAPGRAATSPAAPCATPGPAPRTAPAPPGRPPPQHRRAAGVDVGGEVGGERSTCRRRPRPRRPRASGAAGRRRSTRPQGVQLGSRPTNSPPACPTRSGGRGRHGAPAAAPAQPRGAGRSVRRRAAAAVRSAPRRGRRAGQRRVVVEDRGLQGAQLGRRVEAELVGEQRRGSRVNARSASAWRPER